MNLTEIVDKISQILPFEIAFGHVKDIEIITITVEKEDLLETIEILKNSSELKFNCLIDITCVDYPNKKERFELIYNLLSLKNNRRLIIKTFADDTEEDQTPSISSLFINAGWYEREIFDLFGVRFIGNNDLRRILTDYGFIGHPLRKDFPLSGFVEVRYDNVLKKVIYEPVSLPQEYRSFNYLSPWEGTKYQLPGDEKATTK